MINMRHYLRPTQQVVLRELEAMLSGGEAPSVRTLAERTPLHYMTVLRALHGLRACGLVRMEQERWGCRARYEIVEE